MLSKIYQEDHFFRKHPKIQETLQRITLPENVILKEECLQFEGSGYFLGNTNPIRNNYGIMLYTVSHMYYIGKWVNNRKEGYGILVSEDGSHYSGEWYRDKPHGKGEYFNPDGSWSYSGRWKYGEMDGEGIERYPDGTEFRGNFKNSQKNGKGKFTFSNPKCTFRGMFVDDKATGRGIQQGLNYTYEGEWKENIIDGVGRCLYRDEAGNIVEEYIGQFKNGLKSGYGEYKFQNGQLYKGEWEEGQMKSVGVFVSKDCGLFS